MLTNGELFVVAFIVVAVVSAPWWPRLGEAIFTAILGQNTRGRPREQKR